MTNRVMERVFDFGEAFRAVWVHEDGSRHQGLFPGIPAAGLWWTCHCASSEPRRVYLLEIRPMIDEEP